MNEQILAVITLDSSLVGGGAPIFYARDQKELEEISLLISRIFGAAVHDLQNDVLIIVKH